MKSISTLALLAAAGLLAGGALAGPTAARAADLGGDCCSDLEARVAELEATTARKGNKKVSLAITGRVNYNILVWSEHSTGPSTADFDKTSGFYIGNIGRNESRLLFKGDGKISSDLTGGFSMEIFDDPSNASPNDTQTTHQSGLSLAGKATYVFLKSKSVGETRLGFMYGVVHDGFYQDLGTDTIGRYAQTRDVAKFRLRDANGKLTDTYQSVLKPIEDSRENRLMFISPALAGFTLKADVGGDSVWGAALAYDNKFGTVSLKAAAGYQASSRSDASFNSDGTLGDQMVQIKNNETVYLTSLTNSNLRMFAASASISESGSGLYLTGEYSRAYADVTARQDAFNWMVKGGWQKNVNGLGNTAIYASYFRQDNLWQNDTTGHIVAVGVDQAIDSIASNIYLQYQHDSFDTSGVVTAGGVAIDAQSLDAVIGGMIVNF